MACEANDAIRTAVSLTGEEDYLRLYSSSLELPLKRCTAVWRNLLYSFSQATAFFAIALSFWFGSRLAADQEYSTQLLEPSKLVMRSLSSLTSRLLKVRPRTLSNCSIRFPRSTRSHQKARFWATGRSEDTSNSRMFTSVTHQGQVSVFCAILLWKSNLGPMLRWLVPVDAEKALRKSHKWYPLVVTDPNVNSIQLIERFYDPLAGSVLVRDFFPSWRDINP